MASRKNYTKEQMAKAIEDVRKGEKVTTAATKYGVPRITLRNKITGKSPIDRNPGPDTVLTLQEESLLVRWIVLMAEKHFPVTRDQLLDTVQKIVADKNLVSCPFSNNRPGKKWFASFLKRHPELSERAAQNLSKARDDVTEADILNWFDVIKTYISDKDLRDTINDPKRIFNADESAFYLQPKAGRVIVRKGEKNVYAASGDEKENLTVLVTGNAAGVLAPPMVVYPYERLPAVIANSVPNDWGVGRSETGWMCAKTFYEYITNVFNPWLEKNNISKPIILFLDGHRSHMTLHLSDFCKDNGIELIALYPNSTHLLQPMDVAVFRPLKVAWKTQVKDWKLGNPQQTMKKEHFAPNLEAALKSITADTVRNGFRKSGLFPFGPEYVDMNKLSSHNRATVSTLTFEKKVDAAKQFMNTLDSEIRAMFTNEKLNLFSRLYYMSRADVEEILPNEDLSLYTIWAKTKHFLAENLPQTSTATTLDRSLQSTEPEPIRENVTLPQIDATITSERSLQVSPSSGTETLKECIEPPTVSASISKPSLPISQTSENKPLKECVGTIHHTDATISPEIFLQDSQCFEIKSPKEKTLPPTDASTILKQSSQVSQTPNPEPFKEYVDTLPVKTPEGFLEANSSISGLPEITLYESDQKSRKTLKNFGTENIQPHHLPRPSMSSVCAGNETIDGDNPDVGSQMQLSKTFSKDISLSAIYTTPNKAQSSKENTISKSLPLKSHNLFEENIPSPFKRALFWPEPDIKKRRTKERIPAAITGDAWRSYVIKKVNEKKKKEDQKKQRIQERTEKQLLKMKMAEEKILTNKKKILKTVTRKRNMRESSSSSSEENRVESDQDVELSTDDQIYQQENHTESEESEEDNVPLRALQLKKNTYVIIKYEGEYFPGLIKNVDGRSYEISTMILSKGNTFRWPETPDQIWYDKQAIIEKIQEPQIFNKRGFYKVPEMKKFLPFICE